MAFQWEVETAPSKQKLADICLKLPREISLGQDLVAFSLQHRGGALVVIDVKHEKGFAAGTHKQGIAEEKVHLGHEQTAEDMPQIGGTFRQFDHQYGGLAERNVMLMEEIGDEDGITHDHPGYGGLRGIDNAERQNNHPLLLEELHHLEERPDFVVQKDGEVTYRGAGYAFLGGGRWLRHGRFFW